MRGDIKDNIHFVEENTIIYPVGHTVVSYNVETKVQRFTPGSPESEGITALAVSPNKKFLAVAERADKGTISVYDLQTLKRRKVLVSSETGARVRTATSKRPRQCLQACRQTAATCDILRTLFLSCTTQPD